MIDGFSFFIFQGPQGIQGPPGIKGDKGMDGQKGEPVSQLLS